MANRTASEIATLSAALRAELKEWERGFAAANGGKKASSADIKEVPEIAAKYKEYQRLRALEASSSLLSAAGAANGHDKPSPTKSLDSENHSKKRKHTSPSGPGNPPALTTSTPRKTARGGAFETPSKARSSHPADVDPYDSPSALRRLFSPSTHMNSSSPLKSAIGPTPQRDGKALGLFDLLSESGGSTATPSAARIASVKGMTAQTPSRKRQMDTILEEDEEVEEDDTPRGVRTPASSGKKYMLSNLFATPTAWRYSAMVENDDHTGFPTNTEDQSTSPQLNRDDDESATPTFLKRSMSGRYVPSSHPAGGAGAAGLSPIAVRKPPQFVGKGLSALVRGLRDMEEERLDEELDVLREIEAEQAALNVEVPDSQVPGNDNIRRVKKKGQKRTTRMVRMRPVIAAKPKEQPPGMGEGSASEDELVTIEDTQQPTTPARNTEGNGFEDGFEDDASLHTMSEPDLDSDDPDYEGGSKPLAKSKSFSEKMKEAIGVVQPPRKDVREKTSRSKEKEKEQNKENKKPTARKVNPQAHANYRSLKIRNKGSKGRGAGRFGRRR